MGAETEPVESEAPRRETSLTSAAARITTARTIQMAVVFLLSLALVRLLPDVEYGTYLHVTFLASVVPLLVSIWAGKTIVFFLPRTRSPARLLRGIGAIELVLAAVAALAIVFLPDVLRAFDADDARLVEHRAVIGLTIGVAFPYTVAEQVMLARGARRGFAGVLLLVSAALFLGVGGALLLAHPDDRLRLALWGLFGAHAAQGVTALVWLFLPPDPPGPEARETSARHIAAFAVPVAGAAIVSLLAVRIDGLLVPALFGEEVKAYYLRGAMEIPVIGAIAFTLLSLVAPEVSRLHAVGDRGAMLYLWRRSCRVVGVLSVPVVCAVQAVADDLFTLAYPGMEESVPVFRWYTSLLLVRIFLPQVLMENTGGARLTVVVAVTNLLLAVGLCAALLPIVGWVGAAPAMVLATLAANWVVGGELARRDLDATWGELLDWNGLARVTLASLAALAAARGVLLLEAVAALPQVVRIVVGSAVFGLAFVLAALPLRAVHRDDLDAVRRALPRRLGGI